MNPLGESQLVSAVNAPRLHEVTEWWDGGSKRETGLLCALCWFIRGRGFSLSEVVVIGKQPELQTFSLAGTKPPSGMLGPFLNSTMSFREPDWSKLVRLRQDTPQKAVKINLLVLCWNSLDVETQLWRRFPRERSRVTSHNEASAAESSKRSTPKQIYECDWSCCRLVYL